MTLSIRIRNILLLFVVINASVTANGTKPNFIFILTDDQDRILGESGYTSYGSMEIMPNLKEKLIDEGAIVENFLVNTPICCPSRTEFFTGRYYHNVGPPNVENGDCMHVDTTIAGSNTTGLFGLLKTHGYEVGLFGKITNNQPEIMNQMSGEAKSVTYLDSPIHESRYMGYDYFRYWSDNDTTFTELIDKNDPIFGTAYQTTQLGNRTLRWLESLINKNDDGNPSPFFAYIGPHAPHYSAQPAPWYEHAFDNINAPITPNYNLSSPDKAQHVRQNPPLDDRVNCWENQHFRNRWASLLSVDDIIKDIYDFLEENSLLENTYIIYSSDHGYKQGQWRIGTSKQHPYETDIRVPFIIRGPGISPGKNVTNIIAGNVDLMPTILDLSGIEEVVEDTIDGKSLSRILTSDDNENPTFGFRQYFLNEYKSVGTYYNDHGTIWQDGSTTSERCKTGPDSDSGPVGPDPSTLPEDCVESEGLEDGNCWIVDSTNSNSWRQLRIMNETMNWNYVEYDPAFEFKVKDSSGAGLQHYELYDVDEDPYQMNNLYTSTSIEIKTALHQQLEEYFRCKGMSCP